MCENILQKEDKSTNTIQFLDFKKAEHQCYPICLDCKNESA